MNNASIVLTATLLAATSSPAGDGLRIRYDDPTGPLSVSVSHDITVRRDEPIEAGRAFEFGLSVASGPEAGSVTVTIDRARGSYTVHGMKQRLDTRHLTGESFRLSIGDGGRSLRAAGSAEALAIGLGPGTAPGFSVVELLLDVLPILPQDDVAVGTTWTVEHPVRSLEGWTWASGTLSGTHRITAVEQRQGRTVVTARTQARADLGPLEGGKELSGDLQRALRWEFDATRGRLLSLSMEQETETTSPVPQGHMTIHQRTRVELAPPAS